MYLQVESAEAQKGEHMKEETKLYLWRVDAYHNGKLHDSKIYKFRSEANNVARDIRKLNGWNARVRTIIATID